MIGASYLFSARLVSVGMSFLCISEEKEMSDTKELNQKINNKHEYRGKWNIFRWRKKALIRWSCDQPLYNTLTGPTLVRYRPMLAPKLPRALISKRYHFKMLCRGELSHSFHSNTKFENIVMQACLRKHRSKQTNSVLIFQLAISIVNTLTILSAFTFTSIDLVIEPRLSLTNQSMGVTGSRENGE